MIPREVLRQVRRLKLVSRRAARVGPGAATRRAAPGAGLAFEEVRAYSGEDDARSIDWNVTARAGSPFVKRYAEERELTLIVLADRGPRMGFGSGRRTKAQVAAELGAVLALAAAARGDRVGLAAGDGRLPPPSRGTPHAARLARDLLAAAGSAGPPVAPALARLGGRRVPRAVLAVLSDFADAPAGEFARGFRRAAGRHDLLCVRVADPRELALPDAGLVALRDAASGRQVVIDTGDARVRAEFARRAQAARERFARFAASCGASLADCRTDGGHFDALAAHLAARAGATP